jgi:hypothetical protein
LSDRVIIWDVDSSVDFVIGKSDIILICDNVDNCLQWLEEVRVENGGAHPQKIFRLKAGASAYNPFIFGKYLQYALQKNDTVHATIEFEDTQIGFLFNIWEKLVGLFKERALFQCENLIEIFEAQIEKEAFFVKKQNLLFIIKLYTNLFIDNYLLKYSEDFKAVYRNQISFRHNTKLNHKITLSKSILRKIEEKYSNRFLVAFQNVLKLFNKILSARNFADYLLSVSSYMLILAKLANFNKDYPKTVLLCHRALDLYFLHLQKQNSLPEERFMISKYNDLVGNSILQSDRNIGLSIDLINQCRNFLIYTHGDYGVTNSMASNILSKTIKIISTIEGSNSLWVKFEKMDIFLDLDFFDIFSFEYSLGGSFKEVRL